MNNEIINRLERIETKLDNVIKALHEYDGNDEYGESSFEAFMDSKTNEGSHYITNEEADEDAEFSDYGMRIAKEVMSDKDNIRVGKNNNTQNKRRGGKKNKRKVDPIVQHQQFRQPHKN